MIRIGDFSKLSCVTIKTLRYYDEMGLLKPVSVDMFTGYRYYEYEQLARLHRILALRDLGFSLQEITRLLDEGLSSDKMRGMLMLRQSEIRQQMAAEGERLQRVESWLRQIEQEETMSKYDIVVKKIEPIRVASIRGVVPTPPDQGSLWEELGTFMEKTHPVGPCLTLYHDKEHKEIDWDIEVCEQVPDEAKATPRINVYSLPGYEKAACLLYKGPFNNLGEPYDAIMKWMEENGYQIIGPCREVYLQEAVAGKQDDPNTLTEIQFPVEKVK
jgi:effector-binding domain-containing protein